MRGLVRAGEPNAVRRALRPRHAIGAVALGLAATLPTFAGCTSGAPTGAAAIYREHCTGCHGDRGRGDGLQARLTFLKVPSFADPARMAQLTDDYLYTVIAKGSAALGGTSAMPGWDHILTPEQVRALVAYIRAFAASPPPPR